MVLPRAAAWTSLPPTMVPGRIRLLAALAALVFAALAAQAGEAVNLVPPGVQRLALTEGERAWLAAHPAITIALDDGNPPLNFRQADGGYAGISVDYLRLITAKVGLELHLEGSTWSEALAKAMAHQVDGLMSASDKAERRVALGFTAAYCVTPVAMVTAQDFPQVENLAGFARRRVAVVAGTIRIPLLKDHCPTATLVEVATAQDGIKALTEGGAEAFFDDLPVVQNFIDHHMISRLRVALLYFIPEVGAQRVAVRNDRPELLAILDKAIAAISPDEHRAIQDRWLRLADKAVVQRDLGLTVGERAWLTAHPVVRVGCDPAWPPLEWVDDQGRRQGISADYLKRLEGMLGIRFEIDAATAWPDIMRRAAAGQIDVVACMGDTPERRRQFAFTKAYVTFPISIFARNEVGYVAGIEALAGRRVVVVRGYVEDEQLRIGHPELTLIQVSTVEEALARLRRGEADAYVGGLLPTAFQIQKQGEFAIHVVGETPYVYRQAMAVRPDWPELAAILDKALAAIPPEDRTAMERKWVSLRFEHGFDAALLWQLGIPLAVVLALFVFWNRRLRAEVRQRTRVEAELVAYRDRLEDLVQARTADLQAALSDLRRLAAAVDQAAEGVVIADPDGRIAFVNPAFTRLTGRDASAAMRLDLASIGLPWNDSALRQGRWQGRIALRRPDGSGVDIEATVSAVTAGGSLVNLVSILRDITVERGIELRLAQSQKLEAIGTLAGGIAHDFNNILTMIIGSAELAARANADEARRVKSLETILTASDRARDLVRQILTFARGRPVKRRPVELAAVVHAGLKLIRASLPASIEISTDLAAPIQILGDPTQIDQILMNLCTNAGLAMPDGGRLDIGLARVELDAGDAALQVGLNPGPHARLTVRDTGVGMTPEIQARIFEPFFTTRSNGSGTGKGTGLGLAVVHGIVRDYGGAISVASEPGRGTTFTIHLPLADHAAEPAPVEAASLPRGSERILFVDDEPVLRVLAEEMLGSLGYRVTVASDGQAALEELERTPTGFDLVITDTSMPRMTGLVLIAELRRRFPALPIIQCSGESDGEGHAGVQTGAARFLAKPMTIAELATAVREVLDG